jgi:hypothetical protein
LKNDRIVDNLAGLVQKDTVHTFTGGQRFLIFSDAGGQVFGETDLQEVPRPGSLDSNDVHVARVEDTGTGQNNEMFLFGTARIPQRHVVGSEYRHVGAVVDVPAVKAGLLDGLAHGFFSDQDLVFTPSIKSMNQIKVIE